MECEYNNPHNCYTIAVKKDGQVLEEYLSKHFSKFVWWGWWSGIMWRFRQKEYKGKGLASGGSLRMCTSSPVLLFWFHTRCGICARLARVELAYWEEDWEWRVPRTSQERFLMSSTHSQWLCNLTLADLSKHGKVIPLPLCRQCKRVEFDLSQKHKSVLLFVLFQTQGSLHEEICDLCGWRSSSGSSLTETQTHWHWISCQPC